MGLVVIFDDVSVRSVAEGRIGGVLAVAELVVSAFIDVEADRSASSDTRVAWAVAAGIAETHPAGTPGVDLALLQVGVVREVTWVRGTVPVMKGMLGGRYFPSR